MSNNEVMKLEEDKDLKGEFKELCKAPVSYTHLTLPTIEP